MNAGRFKLASPAGLCRALTYAGLAAALAMVVFAQPTWAQTDKADAADDSAIVVQGVRGRPTDGAAARSFVAAMALSRSGTQLARWADAVCPRIIGVGPDLSGRVAARIRSVADQAGIPVAAPGCKANIGVVFVRSGADYVAALHKRAPARLAEVPHRHRGFVTGDAAPMRWWYNTELRGRGGRPLTVSEPGFVQCEGQCDAGSVLPSGPDTKFLSDHTNSRIAAATERYIRTATVVIDTALADGTAVDAVADFAALVALAEIWPEAQPAPVDTILSLFADSAPVAGPPRSLSGMDRRFLCELYRLPLDRSGRYQTGRIVRALTADAGACRDIVTQSVP